MQLSPASLSYERNRYIFFSVPHTIMQALLMKRFFIISLFSYLFCTFSLAAKEHFILTGGPALRQWEDLRVKPEQHDRWWANFIRASTLRIDNLRKAYGKTSKVTWVVYRPGYVRRSSEDGKPYTTWITEQATKRNCKLIWVDSNSQLISAFNNRGRKSIISFDYFGHSNKYCFLIDYSNFIMGGAKCWLHENDLRKIKRSVLANNAPCQSWGCHTGESMSGFWRNHFGVPLVGAKGKTDYSVVGQGVMPKLNGTWIR